MYYLTGITIANGTKAKTRNFKKLKIPFQTFKEIEKFRFGMEQDLPGKRVYFKYIEKP